MQLVAYGAQDIYLTGNPQITFFKVVYRRHTNFSMECIQQTINGSQTVGTSASNGTVTISRNGDLVHKVYVRCDQGGATTTQIAADRLIETVELEIGGQKIDKHYQEWLQIWSELSTPESKAAGYKYMTGGFSNTLLSQPGTGQNCVQVPLQFWFCRNPGLALPLIALQYHEVKLKFTWGASDTGTGPARDNGGTVAPTCEVWVDYVYLDTDERRRFAQQSHEYLIEQLQLESDSSTTPSSIKLNFNHPVKELIWTSSDTKITTQKAKLTLNGHDRFAYQNREFFQLRQPMDHHSAVPGYNIKETEQAQLITPPINTGVGDANGDNLVIGAHGAGGHGGNPLTANQIGYVENDNNALGIFNANVAAGTTPTTKIAKVGDLVQVTFVDSSLMAGGTAADINGGVSVTLATVTGISYTATVEEYLTFDKVVVPVNPAAADSIRIDIIGRLQDPKSRCSQLDRSINCYSFALKPEEHQPSGTCNFSRIDTAKLDFDAALATDTTAFGANSGTNVTAQTVNIYAVNYNVLRIMSGMGGLAYSN